MVLAVLLAESIPEGGRMNRSRVSQLLVLCALLVASVGVTTMTVSARADIQITSVNATPDDPTTGEQVTVETTIQNLQSSNESIDITSIFLQGPGSFERYGRIRGLGSVAPGASVTVPLFATFDEPGQKRLTAEITVRTESGDFRRYSSPVFFTVEEPLVRADLAADPNQSDTTEIELTNLGNVALTDVEVTATDDGDVVARRLLADVEPNTSRRAILDTGRPTNETLRVVASYEAAGENRTTTITTTVQEEVLGEVRLTGIEASRTGSSVLLDGEAANVGSTDVESVLVRVPNSSEVNPVAPSGEYFVGLIDASEFATFELTADVGPDTETIPVEITFIVDDERVTTTQQIDIGSAAGPGSQGTANSDGQTGGDTGGLSGGLPLGVIGLVVVLLVLAGAGFGVYRWRSQ